MDEKQRIWLRCWGFRIAFVMHLVIVQFLSSDAFAQRNEIFETAMNNYGHETVECAAYFTVVAGVIANTPGREKLVDGYRKQSEVLFQRAVAIAEQIDQKLEAVAARFEIASKDMMGTLGGNVANFSILLNKYSDHCVMVSNDVRTRGQYWIERAKAELEATKKRR